jgi:cytochrome c biogenesis protein CcdA
MVTMTAISFIAGLLSFFAPCGSFLLPGFFAYAFQRRTAFLAATWWFLAGFLALFIPVGLGLQALTAPLVLHRQGFVWAGGLVLIALGGLALAGKGLHVRVPRLGRAGRTDAPSVFLMGLVFGVTAAGCTAPLMALALAFATVSGSTAASIVVLAAFGTGLVSPLFALSFVADKKGWLASPVLKGRLWTFTFFGKERTLHSTNALAAGMLFLIGTVFITSQGTFYVTSGGHEWLIELNARLANFLARFR